MINPLFIHVLTPTSRDNRHWLNRKFIYPIKIHLLDWSSPITRPNHRVFIFVWYYAVDNRHFPSRKFIYPIKIRLLDGSSPLTRPNHSVFIFVRYYVVDNILTCYSPIYLSHRHLVLVSDPFMYHIEIYLLD